MHPQQILAILRARYKIAIALLLLTLAIALPVIHFLPKQYSASAALVIDVRAPDPITAMLRPSSMATQEDIIKSDRVAQRVIKVLGLQDNPMARQQWQEATHGEGRYEVWLAELLQRKLVVAPPRRDSNILTIEYGASDPRFAAAVANAFAQAYMDIAVELKVEPAKQYARWFAEQGKSQRETLEKAQARLSEFQQKRGIVAKDETLDTETARLTALDGQLTILQQQTADSRSKQRSGAENLPEIQGNPLIAGLRQDINKQEVKMKDARTNLGENHPRYQAMESELAALKERLAFETRQTSRGYGTSGTVGAERERELRAAIEDQKRKLLQLRSERDQLAVLQRDVDAAKNAYDAVSNRYTQVSLESQATQTNVYLLNTAEPPLAPSSPKVPRLMGMSVLFGIMLGLGAAFGWEFLDRRVRSAADLAQMLQMPVLSVVPDLAAPPRRRLGFWRRPALPAP